MRFLPALMACAGLLVPWAHAGGPKYVAGASYFNPGVLGQPLYWSNGQVSYYVDQGSLTGSIDNAQATAMVDAAAAIWSGVPTAAVVLTDQGHLAEDVNGSNIVASSTGGILEPVDVASTATATPVGVIFDEDGSVIDALEGSGASEPDNCTQNSVIVYTDNINPNATIAHSILILNGLCATSSSLLSMMSFQLERAFGQVLGLGFSQVNTTALADPTGEPSGTLAWPVMQPLSGTCDAQGGTCIPNPTELKYDDIAALNRIYPVTAANLSSFSGKVLTASNTVSIHGTLSFRQGGGMQGVNVVARPLDSAGNVLYQYTATAVSGAYFCGNRGNAISGYTDANGDRYDRFGSTNSVFQGYFDLSDMPLPPGATSANYQISFEAINPLYIDASFVGPYVLGSPSPSGTLATITVNGVTAGAAQTVNATIDDSATANANSQIGAEDAPRKLPVTGMWSNKLSEPGQSDWMVFPVRGNRIFTIVLQALNESSAPSSSKAMPEIGVWDATDEVGSAAVGWAPAGNGFATGETWLQVATNGQDTVRMGIADQRGDGRPDYAYNGWVLYADTVTPSHLPATGGAIVIEGTGFRAADTVTVGGNSATVTSLTPNRITALAPAAATGVTGSQDVVVSDLPTFTASATIPGGVSYDAATGDSLTLVTAPSNTVPEGVPQAFTVTALASDGTPASGVTVNYAVTSGSATLGCGQVACAVTATGDGRATLNVTASNTSPAVVTASLANGAGLQAHFVGGAPPSIAALATTLYLAAGATANWPVEALVLANGSPVSGQSVTWASVSGLAPSSSASTTNASGQASVTMTAGPLSEGQTATTTACVSGTSQCANFSVFGSRPEYATLAPVSGTEQSIAYSATPSTVIMRALDIDGNPMAGGVVTVNQALYSWPAPCPPRGRCAQPRLLAKQTVTATSALDGSVTIAPLTMAGEPSALIGIATTGNAGRLTFTVEQHP